MSPMSFDDDSPQREEELLAWLRQHRASRLVHALLETDGTDDALAALDAHGLFHPCVESRQLRRAQQVLVALCRALVTGHEEGRLRAASLAFERSFPSSAEGESEDDDEPTQAIHPAEPMTLFRKTSPQTPDSRRSTAAGTTTSGTLRGFPPPLEPPASSDEGSPPIAEDEGSAPPALEVSTTGCIDVARLMTGFSKGDTAGLPFQPPWAPDKVTSQAPTAQRPAVAQAPHPAAGETEGMDEADIAAAIASAAAANPKRSSLPMPVEHYAALVVQSQQAGSMDRLERIHTAFGIKGHAHRSQIDQAFTEALAKDETLRAYFTATLRRLTIGP